MGSKDFEIFRSVHYTQILINILLIWYQHESAILLKFWPTLIMALAFQNLVEIFFNLILHMDFFNILTPYFIASRLPIFLGINLKTNRVLWGKSMNTGA